MTIKEAKKTGMECLKNSPTVSLDISCLLQWILNKDKTFILLHNDDTLSADEEHKFMESIKSRASGLPIAYITGTKEFFGYEFIVSRDVLIPKPDTEILVENAVEKILQKIADKKNLSICDMCTGSGCIAISVFLTLKKSGVSTEKLPDFTLVDISESALTIAKKNAEKLLPYDLHKFKFIQSNLFENVKNQFDFILTNPPYVPKNLVQEILKDGRSEPALALDGDVDTKNFSESSSNDGLEIIRTLLPEMKNKLFDGGMFFMEAGEYNAESALQIAEKNGFKNLKIIPDLEGQNRVVQGVIKY